MLHKFACEPGQPEMELHSRLPGTSLLYLEKVRSSSSTICLRSLKLLSIITTQGMEYSKRILGSIG